MENEKDLNWIIEPMMEKMKNFAGEVPDENFMAYFYKVHDIMEYYENFINAENEEDLKKIQEQILSKIASYYM